MASTMEIPKTMSGIVIDKTGGSDELHFRDDLPVPQPAEGEVLMRNEYIGVNFIDIYFRSGLYPVKSFPHILGSESTGTIVAVGTGETYGLKPGDRVVSLSKSAYAQYCTGAALHTYKLPDDADAKTAVATWIQGITAMSMIEESYHVNKGDWILLHAAAGGTGLLLLQLLKQKGAHVIATCSTAKVDLVKSHGAEVVHDYSKGDMAELVNVVKQNTGGKGVACVYDGVGKDTFDTSMECLARNGSLISFGNASGKPEPLVIGRLMAKNLRVMRPTVFGYIEERADYERYGGELLDALKGGLDARIYKAYPLKEVAAAQDDLAGRKTTGKVLLHL